MDSQMLTHILSPILPLLVPYLTEAIRKGYETVMTTTPVWLKPFKPMIAGWAVAAVAKGTGVELPGGLEHISNDQTTQIILSGAILGAIGSWLHDAVDGLKKKFAPTTFVGKVINAISGDHAADQLAQTPPK